MFRCPRWQSSLGPYDSLLRRWSCNGHWSMTLGENLHAHWPGLMWHRTLWVNEVHSDVDLEMAVCCWYCRDYTHSFHCLGFLGDRAVWVGRVLLRRWSGNGHWLMTLGSDSTFIIQVTWDTELFDLVEFYLEDSPKMISLLTLGKRLCTVIVHVSGDRELFELVHGSYTWEMSWNRRPLSCNAGVFPNSATLCNSAGVLLMSSRTELFN